MEDFALANPVFMQKIIASGKLEGVSKCLAIRRGKKCRSKVKKDMQRWKHSFKILRELILNEKRYLSNIETLVEVFLEPMRAKKVLPNEELDLLFPLLSDLCASSRGIIDLLENYTSNPLGTLMGMAAAQLPPKLAVLHGYLEAYGPALGTYALVQRKKEVQAFIAAAERNSRCLGSGTIEAYLALPMQRMSQYASVIQRLVELHPSMQSESLNHLSSALDMINTDIHERDYMAVDKNQKELVALQLTLTGKNVPKLPEARRWIVHRGTCTTKGKSVSHGRYLVLCNDILIMSKPEKAKGRAGMFEVEHVYPIADAVLQEALDGSPDHIKGMNYCLSLQLTSKHYGLGLESASEKAEWLEKFQCVGVKKKALTLTPSKSQAKMIKGPTLSLHAHAAMGNVAAVLEMVEHGESIEKLDENGQTVLHIAVVLGHQEMIMTILSLDIDVDVFDKRMRTPLHTAAITGQPDIVGVLCDHGAVVDSPDHIGNSPLVLAAADAPPRSLAETVEELLVNGADPNFNRGAALWALLNREPPVPEAIAVAVVDALLNRGLNVSTTNSEHCTSLHCASILGLENLARRLLQGGCKPNVMNDEGCTALHLKANAAVGSVLASFGARPSIQNKAGKPASVDPADYAAFSRYGTLKHKDVCKSVRLRPVLSTQKDQWVENDKSPTCMLCDEKFTLTVRRHHCRFCGLLLCSSCSSKAVHFAGENKESRVCDGCFNLLCYMCETGKTSQPHYVPQKPAVKKATWADVQAVTDFSSPSDSDSLARSSAASRQARQTSMQAQQRDDLLAGADPEPPSKSRAAAEREFDNLMAQAGVEQSFKEAAQAKQSLIERGEKLQSLKEKMDDMNNEAANFGDLCAQLAAKQKAKSKWGF